MITDWWHRLAYVRTFMSKSEVGTIMLRRRRWSRYTTLSAQYADGPDAWTPEVPADPDLVSEAARCGSADELRAVLRRWTSP